MHTIFIRITVFISLIHAVISSGLGVWFVMVVLIRFIVYFGYIAVAVCICVTVIAMHDISIVSVGLHEITSGINRCLKKAIELLDMV